MHSLQGMVGLESLTSSYILQHSLIHSSDVFLQGRLWSHSPSLYIGRFQPSLLHHKPGVREKAQFFCTGVCLFTFLVGSYFPCGSLLGPGDLLASSFSSPSCYITLSGFQSQTDLLLFTTLLSPYAQDLSSDNWDSPCKYLFDYNSCWDLLLCWFP